MEVRSYKFSNKRLRCELSQGLTVGEEVYRDLETGRERIVEQIDVVIRVRLKWVQGDRESKVKVTLRVLGFVTERMVSSHKSGKTKKRLVPSLYL